MDEEKTGQRPEIRAAFLPRGGDALPDDVQVAAEAVGRQFDAEILAGGLDFLLVLVLRPNGVERWEVRGDPPCGIDDLIRSFAALGEAEAVAFVHGCNLDMGGGVTRTGVACILEQGGQRATRVLPLDIPAEGPPVALRSMVRLEEPLAEGAGWIGVPSSVDLGLRPIGPTAGAVGAVGDA